MTGRDIFEQKAFAGKPVDFCTVVDAHCHIGECFGMPYVDSTATALISAMDRMGVRAACVSATPGLMGLARRGNDTLIDAMQEYPGRIFGYAVVDIGFPETIISELERCAAAGIRAIKIWSYGGRPGLPYDHPNYDIVCEFADSNGFPILAHTFSAEEISHLERRLEKYRNVDFLLAHTGSFDRAAYVRVAKEYPNAYLETCLSSCPRGLIEHLVGEGLAPKTIWGSDSLFMGAEQQVGRVIFANISEQHKRAILGANAVKILDLPLKEQH